MINDFDNFYLTSIEPKAHEHFDPEMAGAVLNLHLQAIGPDDLHDPIDVIGVDVSRNRLEQYLTAYRARHRVACVELEARLLEYGDAWESVHDRVYDEIAAKHHLGGTLVPEPDAIFEILEVNTVRS